MGQFIQFLGVSENRGIYPQIIHFNKFSIINHPFWGIPIFWKHPYGTVAFYGIHEQVDKIINPMKVIITVDGTQKSRPHHRLDGAKTL